MRKKIGIVGWNTGDNSFGVTKAYLNFLNYFGNVQVITPQQDIVEDLDLLILPGGKDVNPLRYDGIPDWFNTDPNSILEYFDIQKLPQYIELGIPVFGICRGFQTLNVHFGGSLTQNHVHEQSTKFRGDLVHDLSLTQNVPKEIILISDKKKQTWRLKVNSLHHQVIMEEDLADSLLETLIHTDDEVIEGFIHENLPIAGVQYHPEEIWDNYSIQMIKLLLNFNNKNNDKKTTAESNVLSADTIPTS